MSNFLCGTGIKITQLNFDKVFSGYQPRTNAADSPRRLYQVHLPWKHQDL